VIAGYAAGVLVAIPIVLAFFSPLLLICLALSTGALPLALGPEGWLASDFGRLDLYSIRVFGLWLASMLLIVPSFSLLPDYFLRFRWHVAFLLFAVMAMIWSPSLVYSARMVAKLTAPFLFLLLVMVSVSSWTALRSIERAMWCSGILAVVLTLGAVVGGYTKVSLSTVVGLGIPGLGPAGTSAHLAILSMLAVAAARTRSARAAYVIIALGFSGMVIAGFTRITIAGLFLGAAVVLWMSSSRWFRWVFPLAGVASVPALFVLSETFRRRMFKNQDSISLDMLTREPSAMLDQIHGSGRFDHWAYVMKTFFDPHPLFGSGVGTTQHYFYTHQLGLSVIHSEYVRLLAEVGLIGIVLVILAFLAYMVRLRRIYRLATTNQTKTYALAGLGSLVVYLIFMATDNAIDYVTSSGIFVFCLIAMSEKARDLETAQAAVDRVGAVQEDVPSVAATESVPHRRYPILAG
jgi:O-antigen ligase